MSDHGSSSNRSDDAAKSSVGGSKHTPAPWRCDGNTNGNFYGISAIADGHRAPVVVWRGIARPSSPEGRANARLIAAAPDMLEALLAEEDKRQRGILNMTDAEVARVNTLRRAAIAKATSPADTASPSAATDRTS